MWKINVKHASKGNQNESIIYIYIKHNYTFFLFTRSGVAWRDHVPFQPLPILLSLYHQPSPLLNKHNFSREQKSSKGNLSLPLSLCLSSERVRSPKCGVDHKQSSPLPFFCTKDFERREDNGPTTYRPASIAAVTGTEHRVSKRKKIEKIFV